MTFRQFGGAPRRASFLVAASVTGILLAASTAGWAQTQPTSRDTGPVTGMKPDRTTAPLGVREKMREKEAALRKKRAECRAKAKAEKIPLAKRPAFVKKCRTEAD